jgi:hypothetical protein
MIDGDLDIFDVLIGSSHCSTKIGRRTLASVCFGPYDVSINIDLELFVVPCVHLPEL